MKRIAHTLSHATALSLLLAAPTHVSAGEGVAATLAWSQRVELSSAASGTIEQVRVQPGQHVRQGELLLALDSSAARAAVAEARAEADRLTLEANDAAAELKRAEELYARTVTSTTELEAARLRQARAAALLAAAQARLERARRQLDETELKAPFDAIVLDRQAQPGQVVATACQPPALITLARADELLAEAVIPASARARLKLGQAIGVSTGGQNLRGVVQAIRHERDGRWRIEVRIPASGQLVPGQAASLRLP